MGPKHKLLNYIELEGGGSAKMGRMGQDLGVKSNLKTGMKLKARKMQNLL